MEGKHATGWGQGMTPLQIALLSGAMGGLSGLAQGTMLYDDPELIAAKTTLSALGSGGLGYGLAYLNPYLQAMRHYVPGPMKSSSLNLRAYAEGYFEALERAQA